LKGQKVVSVQNALNFANTKHIRLGRKGDSTTELCHIASISGNDITMSDNLKSDHPENTEVVEMFYDQRKLYKEQTAGAGDYAMTDQKTIQLNNPEGTLFQSIGGAGIHYKCTYYDSVGLTETDLADAEATSEDIEYYATVSDVRRDAGMADNAYITDSDILQSLKDSQSEINSKLASYYTIPLSETPALIRDICAMLTVGRLFQAEYPGIDPTYDKVGKDRTTEARELLSQICKKEIRLITASGEEFTTVTTQRPAGWPNSSTAAMDSLDNGGDNLFRIGQIF
jgi:phage gp36-like protein